MTSGLLIDELIKEQISVESYVVSGIKAYEQLSVLIPHNSVYQFLSRCFVDVIDLLNVVSFFVGVDQTINNQPGFKNSVKRQLSRESIVPERAESPTIFHVDVVTTH